MSQKTFKILEAPTIPKTKLEAVARECPINSLPLPIRRPICTSIDNKIIK